MFFHINVYFWDWILFNLDARVSVISMTTEKWHEQIDFKFLFFTFSFLTLWTWHWPTLTHIEPQRTAAPYPSLTLAHPESGSSKSAARVAAGIAKLERRRNLVALASKSNGSLNGEGFWTKRLFWKIMSCQKFQKWTLCLNFFSGSPCCIFYII